MRWQEGGRWEKGKYYKEVEEKVGGEKRQKVSTGENERDTRI